MVSVRASGQETAPADAAPTQPPPPIREEATAAQLAAVPITGSQIPPDQIFCARCHTEPLLWDEDNQRLFISPEQLQQDIHRQSGVACSDCHGGDPKSMDVTTAHATLLPLDQTRSRCGVCHNDQRLGIVKGVHAKVGAKDERGRGMPLDCAECHGKSPHHILAVTERDSPVFVINQVQTCGRCHPDDKATYDDTVHGKGLYESGLLVTAVCAKCHGAHGIYYAADRRSTLNAANVAATCSKCHQFIEQRLAASIHGQGKGPGSATQQPAMGGTTKREPACTDCHPGHHLLYPALGEFRLEVSSHCGNCHADLSSRYALSMHGELTRQGFAAAANCADCHGSHDVLPINDPKSTLAPGANRLRTCQKCHAYAVVNFTQYDPHANFKDAKRYPNLHGVYTVINDAFSIFFLLALLHAFLWFVRAFVQRLQYGGHTTLVTGQYALPRLGSIHRVTYVFLGIAFLGLTLTGLSLKYSNQVWGQWLADGLGGFRSVSVWHHFFAVVAIVACAAHLGRGVARIAELGRERGWLAVVWGPDSLVPNLRDLRDFGMMLLWFIGFAPKPRFERWTYWEKMDYWFFFLAAILIGASGLMLWYPNLFCLFMSGRMLNVAKVVHSQFAIYIASCLFLVHLFNAHFRPEKFPIDLSVLTGKVSEEHLRKYRPEYIARLEREGKLDAMRVPAPSKRNLWLTIVGGLVIYTIGLCLLAVALLASLGE